MRLYRIVEDFNRRIPASFREVKMARHTPLFVPRTDTDPGVDRTNENLFLRGVPWNPTFISHLKKVFFCKPKMSFKIVTDARIKDVWLGAEAYTSKPKGKREEVETNNVIADLVSENYDLVVVHLGQLMHKNSAAPNVLKEALMYRDNLGLVTWLFQSSDPGAEWFHSRSDELEAYVETKFKGMSLAEDVQVTPMLPARTPKLLPQAIPDMEVEEEPIERVFVPKESRGSSVDSLDDLVNNFMKPSKKKRSGRSA